MGKRRFVADCDDFFGDCVGTVIAHLRESHRDLVQRFETRSGVKMTRENYTVYNLAEVTACSPEQQADVFREYYNSRHFQNMPLLDGTREGVDLLLAQGFEIHLATSRPSYVADMTRAHMKLWRIPIESYHFCGGQSVSNTQLSKGGVCRTLEADAFGDDSAHQVNNCMLESPATRVFLLDSPWNQAMQFPQGVRQASLTTMAQYLQQASTRSPTHPAAYRSPQD